MKEKHVPMRKCSGCGMMKEKSELIRLVRVKNMNNKEIHLDLDFKKFGRGAYVCKNLDCLKACRKSRRFERAFSCKVNDDIYESMEAMLRNE